MNRDSVIAILHDGDTAPLQPGEPGSGPSLRLMSLIDLRPGDLAAGQTEAVLVPISTASDGLPEEVESLRRAAADVPVISYSRAGADDSLLEVSRRLGCITHLHGELTPSAVAETVRRERRLLETLTALRRTREEALREHEKLTHLIEIIKTANSVLEPSRVMEVVMEKARDSLRCELWCLFLCDESTKTLVLERTGEVLKCPPKDLSLPAGQGIEGEVMRTRRPLIINDYPNDPRYDAEFDRRAAFSSRSVMVVPLVSRGRDIGVVRLVNRMPGDAFSPADQSLVTLLMEPAAIALENAILFKKMEQLSVTDDLTQLYNVRYLNGFLYREIKRSQRYRLQVAVIFLDMDGFKLVNDHHGHLAGSQMLAEVGGVLRETVREIDMISRYGGDEFVIVLPQTDIEGAMVIAERIRQNIEQATFLNEMGLAVHITASLGVAAFPEHGASRDEMIHKADAAMYRVKESGKNRVLLAW